jgi:O-antigen ligase
MLRTLLFPCILVWLLLFVRHTARHGFSILMIWLLIAPVASNIVNRPGANPFFRTPSERQFLEELGPLRKGYFGAENSVRLNQLLEPTRTLLGVFLATFLLDILIKRKDWAPFDKTEIWMGIFSLILLAGVLLQSNRSLYSVRIASDAFIVPFFTYFVTKRLVITEDHLRQLIRTVGWLGSSLITVSLIERLLNQGIVYRLAGPFRDSASLSLVTASVFFIVLSDSLSRDISPANRRILILAVRWFILCLSPVIILLTWSRGSWAGFLMGIMVFLFLGRRLVNFSGKILTIGIALTLLAMITIGVQALTFNETVQQRAGARKTVYGRIATWTITLQEGFKHPIFGIGLNNMRGVLARTIIEFEDVKRFPSVHNSFLAIFAEQGITGLFAFLAIIVSIIRMGLRKYRMSIHARDQWRGVAVLAIVAAYLVPGLFASTLHIPNSATMFVIFTFIGGTASLYGRRYSVLTLRPYTPPVTGYASH